jgi:hypothetical protein
MAGMPRAGTTYVYDAMVAHPSIFLPYRKEISFFSSNFSRGESWYNSFFKGSLPGQICADISPDYFLHPESAARILRGGGTQKVILAIRDPASWSVSFHRHLRTFQWNVPTFPEFLDSHQLPNNHILAFCHRDPTAKFSISSSFIQRRIELYRSLFGCNLLLYSFEIFKAQPLRVLQAIERFLGLKQAFKPWNLPRGAINSSQRRNIKLLSYLFSREELIAAARRLIPPVWLQLIRMRFDHLSIPRGVKKLDLDYVSDVTFARTRLAGDEEFVGSLFAAGPIQLGDGQPFD